LNYKLLEAAQNTAANQALQDQLQLELKRSKEKRQHHNHDHAEALQYLSNWFERISRDWADPAVSQVDPFKYSGNEAIASLPIFSKIGDQYFPKTDVLLLSNSDNVYCFEDLMGIRYFLRKTKVEGSVVWSKSTKAEMLNEQASIVVQSNDQCRTTRDMAEGSNCNFDNESKIRIMAREEAILDQQLATDPMINLDQFLKAFGGEVIAHNGNGWVVEYDNCAQSMWDRGTTIYYSFDGCQYGWIKADGGDSGDQWNYLRQKKNEVIEKVMNPEIQ
jgi:hypothetical protein